MALPSYTDEPIPKIRHYHNMKDDKETENDEGSSTSLRQAEQKKQVSAVKVKDNHSKSAATSTEADDDNGVAEKADTNNKIHTLIPGDSNMKNIQNPSGYTAHPRHCSFAC